MKQSQFIEKYSAFWAQLEHQLSTDKSADKPKQPITSNPELPHHYRMLCHQLSLARSRQYSLKLIQRLEHLTLSLHNQLYARRTHWLTRIILFYRNTLPQSVRVNSLLVMLSAVLFMGSLVAMLVSAQFDPDFVYTVLPGDVVRSVENMYDPSNKVIGRENAADGNWYMFGYYIYNNTGIGFRTFATGLIFGIGSLFFLLFNGLYIGAVAGHLTQIGYNETFWSFVAGHSAFELTAIILSGAAGLKMGFSLINPANNTRIQALRKSTRQSLPLIYGAATLFIMAACIEAFWSSSTEIDATVKIVTGCVLWLAVLAYFIMTGRRRAA